MTGPSARRRIIHVTSSISRHGGGIPPVIWSLAGQTQKLGGQSIIGGLRDNHSEIDSDDASGKVITGEVLGPRALGFSPQLRRALNAEVTSSDMVHVHGLWMYPGLLAAALSRRKGCKRMVSPHGMLEPWALKHSAIKKRLASWFFERRNLHTADCLHALCAREAQNFRNYGLRNPIAIIPNGVNLNGLTAGQGDDHVLQEYPGLKDRKVILFLSRVHPKKGLPDLLHAWVNARPGQNNWALLVVGPDESGHEAELQKMADDLGIRQDIIFAGPAYGERKSRLLSFADAFVLPSHSEGFSMAVLEAAAAGLPILLTTECNFPELAAAGAAIEVPAGLAGVSEGLSHFLALTDSERKQMGSRGLELVRQSYTWPAIARQMMAVYNWLEESGPRPDCVHTV
jgi:glycosyltransferase involved in cell wall biosynthesis